MFTPSHSSGEKMSLRSFFHKYSHMWTAVYFFPYLFCFMLLEKKVQSYHVIECPLDERIPFCEYFIIPYLLWFLYIAVTWLYLCFTDKKAFMQYILFIYSGMTIFLLISSLYPNGLELRVDFDPNKNLCTRLVAGLQGTDTSTNVFPSIHVFNSIGAFVALYHAPKLKDKPLVKLLSFTLTLSIVLSTMFLKQHSFIDVCGGLLLSMIFYVLVYMGSLVPDCEEEPVNAYSTY